MTTAKHVKAATDLLRSHTICPAWSKERRRKYAEDIDTEWRAYCRASDRLTGMLRAIGVDEAPHMIGQEDE